ncbi:MAG: hypothetical protein FJ290_24665 [Planctomycetes bacterium]|nr:hypothetical protein [Planctomycetota bacterium]
MAACDRARQWALALCVLSAAVVTGGEEKAVPPEREPARQFNSKLRFSVWAQVEEDGPTKSLGDTPSEQPLAIPSCRRWWVRPLGDRPDLAAVAKELDAQEIPGLKLSAPASDGDLVHVKELKALRWLDLFGTRVTDAGLAHLTDLTGLESLNLTSTQVTDAGLTYLKEFKGLRELRLMVTKVTDAGLAPTQA